MIKPHLYLVESLDELSALVTPLFGDVENKTVPIPQWNDHPCGPDELQVSGMITLWPIISYVGLWSGEL